PKIDVSAMPTCLFSGMFMPAIRATFTFLLTLTLLMTRVGTNHPHHAVAADDFAVPAHFLDRCPDFHELYSETAEDSSAKLAAAPVIAQIGLLHHALVLVAHCVSLHLGHEIHCYDNQDQQRRTAETERDARVEHDQELRQQANACNVERAPERQPSQHLVDVVRGLRPGPDTRHESP